MFLADVAHYRSNGRIQSVRPADCQIGSSVRCRCGLASITRSILVSPILRYRPVLYIRCRCRYAHGTRAIDVRRLDKEYSVCRLGRRECAEILSDFPSDKNRKVIAHTRRGENPFQLRFVASAHLGARHVALLGESFDRRQVALSFRFVQRAFSFQPVGHGAAACYLRGRRACYRGNMTVLLKASIRDTQGR